MTKQWYPNRTRTAYDPPPVGSLIAREHAVWRVTAVADLPLSDADREVWLERGMPDLATWRGRPVDISVEYVGGARPDRAEEGRPVPSAHMKIPATALACRSWDIYPESGRWPMCSCCGEPMPCRAELQDREVASGLAKVELHAKKLPGCCWGCGEPITSRQRAVAYPGDNLDLPGGMPVRFHTRQQCGWRAQQYELRWIAEDPRRERILTYPECGGILVVHADGSTECRSGRKPLGGEATSEPDCHGHLTHDHGVQVSCYVGDSYMFDSELELPGCPRGCDPQRHRGTGAQSRRPERRAASLPSAVEP